MLNYHGAALRTSARAAHSCITKDWAHELTDFRFVWLFAFLSLAAPAFAQPAPAAESAVAATVGDDPIDVAEAQRMMDAIFRDKRSRPAICCRWPRPRCWKRSSIAGSCWPTPAALGDAPSAEELAKAKKQLQIRLAAQGRKVSDVLKAEAITPADLERQVLWRLVWDRYLAKYRTPQRRETWFQNHHRDLDGTELVVSHILLRPAAGAGPKEIEALEKRAESIRAEIISGKIDFAAAAEKYSAGPSSKQGGRLGKIGRHGPMDESFSRAAFELKAGEISPPGPFAVRRAPDPLRRGRARNEEAFRSHRADRRGLGQGAAGKDLPARTAADGGGIHVGLAAFQAGDAGIGEV